MVQAYCVKCRAKKEMKDPKAIKMKNGRPATQGICPACGTRIAETASRCAVCGMVFASGSGRTAKAPARMSGTSASLTLPVGVVIAGPVITLILGALIMVFLLGGPNNPRTQTVPTAPAVSPTITLTGPPTNTSEPTLTHTSLPPFVVTVQAGDTCFGLAAQFGLTDISQMVLPATMAFTVMVLTPVTPVPACTLVIPVQVPSVIPVRKLNPAYRSGILTHLG